MKKYPKQFERDYLFYFQNKEKFNFAGALIIEPKHSELGKDAKSTFYIYDSTGKLPECREVLLYKQIMTCKKSINMHIKLWAEGNDDCLLSIQELLSEFIDPPEWVEISLTKQFDKYLKLQKGSWRRVGQHNVV